ncbi:MAG TPA: PKD domain-containing protein, partial [Puia sp.]
MIRIQLFIICCFLGITSVRAQVPVPDFSASQVSGCGPLGVQFKDLSTNKPVSWAWDFGNGQISSSQNPFINYYAAGTYTVTLIAKNKDGAASVRKTDYITVFPYPTPTFISNYQTACSPTTIQFTDQSTAGQGSITQWTWDFGDGQG